MMSAGCTTFGASNRAAAKAGTAAGQVAAGIDLPELPSELRKKCGTPHVIPGESARARLGRIGQWLVTCGGRAEQLVEFYDGVVAAYERPAAKVK
jgi:hypothetical protein